MAKMVENKLTKEVLKAKKQGKQGRIIKYKDSEADEFGVFSMISYSGKATLTVDKETVVIKDDGFKKKEVSFKDYSIRDINKELAEKLCRCSFDGTGFIGATILENGNSIIVDVETGYGKMRPIAFPVEHSMVGVFCNKDGKTSYVMDGRCKVIAGKLVNISTNQEAINRFLEEQNDDNIEHKRSISSMLSNECWSTSDDEMKLATSEDSEVVQRTKALMFLGETKYMEFPLYENGTPINTAWDYDGKPMLDLVRAYPESMRNHIRYSSLSQNGIVAAAGPLGKMVKDKGKIIGYEVLAPKHFFGTKGKLDIGATQGHKTYIQNGNARALVCLAEVTQRGASMALNTSGNMLSTREAAKYYLTKLTIEKANGITEYPNHKIFIKTDKGLARIKGQCQEVIAEATLEDGTIENRIVIMPPREYSEFGKLDEDLDKFEHICKYRNPNNPIHLVHLVIKDENGVVEEMDVPAIYCSIYEDAAHSAVYANKLKGRNFFYYGTYAVMYKNNTNKQVYKAIHEMVDAKMMCHAMNVAGITKEVIVKKSIDDFLKTI